MGRVLYCWLDIWRKLSSDRETWRRKGETIALTPLIKEIIDIIIKGFLENILKIWHETSQYVAIF